MIIGGVMAGVSAYSAKKQSDAAKKMPTPPAPIPIPELEGDEALKKAGRKKGGRASTILTGDLIPMDIGKKTLLG